MNSNPTLDEFTASRDLLSKFPKFKHQIRDDNMRVRIAVGFNHEHLTEVLVSLLASEKCKLCLMYTDSVQETELKEYLVFDNDNDMVEFHLKWR